MLMNEVTMMKRRKRWLLVSEKGDAREATARQGWRLTIYTRSNTGK